MNRILAAVALSLAMLSAVGSAQTLPTAGAATKVAPIFNGILPALKHVLIPIMLPATFPADFTSKGQHLYASLQEVSPWSYIVTIDYTKDCHGVNACNLAEIDGGPTVNEPNILDYPWGKPVKLMHNTRGLFRPFSCGASCGQSAVVFDDPTTGIIYMVGIHGGSEKDTISLANAMIPSR